MSQSSAPLSLVTGGARGIGKATVNHFLANNWSVITTSTSGEIDYSHPNLYSLKFELGQEDSEDSFVNYFQEKEIVAKIPSQVSQRQNIGTRISNNT